MERIHPGEPETILAQHGDPQRRLKKSGNDHPHGESNTDAQALPKSRGAKGNTEAIITIQYRRTQCRHEAVPRALSSPMKTAAMHTNPTWGTSPASGEHRVPSGRWGPRTITARMIMDTATTVPNRQDQRAQDRISPSATSWRRRGSSRSRRSRITCGQGPLAGAGGNRLGRE